MSTRHRLSFTLQSKDSRQIAEIPVDRLIVAGWSGRDMDAVEAHIAELSALGVARPTSIPTFYRIAARRLTTAGSIQVSGANSSGEAEFILIGIDGAVWVGAASDHTDRKVEAYDVTVSKQMCDKPVAPTLWPLEEVRPHWDRLRLQSHALAGNGQRRLYQDGPVAGLLSAEELMTRLAREDGAGLGPGDAMMGGTLPVLGEVGPAEGFAFALIDPVLNRTIAHNYQIETLPGP